MRDVVIERYEAFDTAGKASKINAKPLEAMFEEDASGALDPVVN